MSSLRTGILFLIWYNSGQDEDLQDIGVESDRSLDIKDTCLYLSFIVDGWLVGPDKKKVSPAPKSFRL